MSHANMLHLLMLLLLALLQLDKLIYRSIELQQHAVWYWPLKFLKFNTHTHNTYVHKWILSFSPFHSMNWILLWWEALHLCCVVFGLDVDWFYRGIELHNSLIYHSSGICLHWTISLIRNRTRIFGSVTREILRIM